MAIPQRKIVLDYALTIYSNGGFCSKFEKTLYDTYNSDITEYKKKSFEKLGELEFIIKKYDKNSLDAKLKELLQDILEKKEGFLSRIYADLKIKKDFVMHQSLFDDTKLEKCEFPCRSKKCRSDQCYFYTEQTRGGDEPVTVFIVCLRCLKRSRFN